MDNESKRFIWSKIVNAILIFASTIAGIFFGGN